MRDLQGNAPRRRPWQSLQEAIEYYGVPEPNTGCWLWAGNLVGGRWLLGLGYGQFRFDGRNVYAHRASWTAYRGEIPVGLDVMHVCDTPACCNPDHLKVGTVSDNMTDAAVKLRVRGWVRGKLTVDNVRTIRRLYEEGQTQQSIANVFGITQVHVSQIVRRMMWRTV